jgi:hypothetical protein
VEHFPLERSLINIGSFESTSLLLVIGKKAETEHDKIFNKHLEKRPSIRSRLATTV